MKLCTSLIEQCLIPDRTLGLIGAGQAGSELLRIAQKAGINTLVCDPPRSEAEAEDLNDDLRQLWGNGMGGCTALPDPDENSLVFLPIELICKQADIIVLLVPLTSQGTHPTQGMLGSDFLLKCRQNAKILCASDPAVIADEAKNDPRIHILPEQQA